MSAMFQSIIGTTGTSGIPSGPDNTPDTVNWAVISGTDDASNAAQTIQGIDSSINVFWERSNSTETSFWSTYYDINGGGWTLIGENTNFSVSNGDALKWRIVTTIGSVNFDLNVKNASDGDALIDVFNCDVEFTF